MNLKAAAKIFEYCTETGNIYWLISPRNGIKPGDIAGSVMPKGHIRIQYKGVRVMAHRLAWALHYGEYPCGQIDHINHDAADNRIQNLTVVDNQGNAKNQKPRRTNTSGVMGVTRQPDCNRWKAQIGVDGRCYHLGLFPDWFDAVCARKAAEVDWGFHSNHGREME